MSMSMMTSFSLTTEIVFSDADIKDAKDQAVFTEATRTMYAETGILPIQNHDGVSWSFDVNMPSCDVLHVYRKDKRRKEGTRKDTSILSLNSLGVGVRRLTTGLYLLGYLQKKGLIQPHIELWWAAFPDRETIGALSYGSKITLEEGAISLGDVPKEASPSSSDAPLPKIGPYQYATDKSVVIPAWCPRIMVRS